MKECLGDAWENYGTISNVMKDDEVLNIDKIVTEFYVNFTEERKTKSGKSDWETIKRQLITFNSMSKQ